MNKIVIVTNNSIARVSNPNMESSKMNNSYDPFVCNWLVEAKKAKAMTVSSLRYAIDDCRECIKLDINPNKYYDQISVYKAELAKRGA